MKTNIAFQLQKYISVQMYMCSTLTSDITRAFALSIFPELLQNSIRPQLLQNSIRPQLLQNSIGPQLLQNGKFLLQALPPIEGWPYSLTK